MGQHSGKTLEEYFGIRNDSLSVARRVPKQKVQQLQKMTPTQRKWFDAIFPKGWSKQELIVQLEEVGSNVFAKEVRHLDFSMLDPYLSAREDGELIEVKGTIPVKGHWRKVRGYQGSGYYRFFWLFTNNNRTNACEIRVDESRHIRKVSAFDVVKMISRAILRLDPGRLQDLNRDDETIENELTNTDDKVFVYELLQNANDYPYGERGVNVEIRVDSDCLCFRHTGAVFSPQNVKAICSINAHDKSSNPNAIGYKGIGFKTVFRNNNRVFIRSGEFSFWFDEHEATRKRFGAPWRRIPLWDSAGSRINMEEYRVGFKLYPQNPEELLGESERGYRSILRKMFGDERVLLFIPKVESVKIILSETDSWCVSKRDGNWLVSDLQAVDIPPDVISLFADEVAKRNIPPKMEGKNKTQVKFACKVEGRRLLCIEDSCLYCFLPAENEKWGFPFLMNTDMIPSGDRYRVRENFELNRCLARIAGEEFLKWINGLIVSGKYDYDSIFTLIPDFEDSVEKHKQSEKYIKAFRDGFESALPTLLIPSLSGRYVPITTIVNDATGVLKAFGGQMWEKFGERRDIAHKSLLNSKAFASFIERYKDEQLHIAEFGFDDLVKAVDCPFFQEWLSNPMANEKFINFLVGKGESCLKKFSASRILLDDKRRLGTPQEMYFDADIEKYLKPFADCFRYLPLSAPCRDKLNRDWFRPFEPRKLVCENLFSIDNEERTRGMLLDVCIARDFFGFLARHKTYTRICKEYYTSYGHRYVREVPKKEALFSRDFLEKLPIVLENGEAVNTIASGEYSVFLSEQAFAQSTIANYNWIAPEWVRFLNTAYFDCEDGDIIRDWFLEVHKQGETSWRLIQSLNTSGVLGAVADKFKANIRKRMLDFGNDLKFYDFIFKCLGEKCINQAWIKKELSNWPVEDTNGKLVERLEKIVFYNNDNILRWIQDGWLDDGVLVLNEKYSIQKELFNLLDVTEYMEDRFGEIFRTVLAPHLNLDTREKVIAFHRFMATRKDLLNANQVAELKKVPILVRGNVNPVVRFDVVYFPTNIDIGNEIATGVISAEIKVLDDELCDDSTMDYWKWLGIKVLDESELLKKRLEEYLNLQKRFVENGANDVVFKEYHKSFISVLASADALKMLKDNGCGDLIKSVHLFTKGGLLVLPNELRFSNEYVPLCRFESFDKSIAYVSEMYCGIENIAELFKELGVKDKFTKDDVALLASTEFCEYFWTKYLNNNPSEWKEIKDCLKANLPCVLDRTGAVRKPEELYHLDIEDYVLKLSDSEARLPMVDGIGKDCLSELEMRTTLSVEDSLAFLLADSECKMYKMRGRVLQWIAECSTTASRELVEEYRNDERALWRNGQKNFVSIKDLCAIRRKNSGRVRLFASDPHVMDMTGLGIGGGDADVMRAKAEDALQWLGVKFVDDDSIDVIPADDRVEDRVISDIAVRMLVFLAERYPDGWEQEFSDMYSQLKNIKFLKSSGLVVRCKDNDWLRAEHGTFLSKGDRFYFVDDWQSKFVYGDMTAELWEKIFKKKYSLDDLKIALDTSGGDEQLASKICSGRVRIVENESFMHKLQELSSSVYGLVIYQLRVPSDTSNQLVEKELSEPCSTKDEQMFVGVSETGIVRSVEAPCESEIAEPAHRKIGQYEVEEDEYEQIQRLFEDGVSESGDMENRKKDESKLACLQIFNYLKNKGLGKMELLIAPLCRYFGLGDKDRELFGILVSRTSAELDEYFKDKGCAEDLLNKVKQVVVSQNKTSYSDGEAVISASVTDGRYAGLSNDDKHSALMEAKEMVMEKLQRKGFEFTQGICENEFSIINGVKKDGVEYPLVVRSYKDSSRPFSLNAADWQQLMKPNSILLVCTNEGVCTVPFKDLICNREQINFTISTANNLDMSDRIAKLTNELRWFKGLRFDFGSLIPMQTSTVQLFDLPENSIPENQKESQMSQDAESEVF